MNSGDPTDRVIEQLIKAAIHTSRLYIWLRNYRFRIFVTCVFIFLYPESNE